MNGRVELCWNLGKWSGQRAATASVVWSNSAGRVGLKFPDLPDPARHRLREWLFLNAMAGAANAAASVPSSTPPGLPPLRPNYTDTLGAASAVQREAESLGADLEAVLSLIALRSHSLLRASGAAIALAGKEKDKDKDDKDKDIDNDNEASALACRASVAP